MARARKILRRLRSIRNIHEVTRAMYMISTARFKHSHDRLAAARPYLKGVMDVASEALSFRPPDAPLHALQSPGPSGKPWVLVVIASRRGLCGSFNNAVAEAAAEHVRKGREAGAKIVIRTSGHRAQLMLEALGKAVEKSYPQFDRVPDPAVVRTIAGELMQEFLSGDIQGVEVAFTRFLSTARQKPSVVRLLPLDIPVAWPAAAGVAGRGVPAGEAVAQRDSSPAAAGKMPAGHMGGTPMPLAPTFLPDAETVRRLVVPEAARVRLYECFLEASVSEHVARMTAMRYASENAEDLIHQLTVRYNRARQSQITMELAEIMGGSEGVEGM